MNADLKNLNALVNVIRGTNIIIQEVLRKTVPTATISVPNTPAQLMGF